MAMEKEYLIISRCNYFWAYIYLTKTNYISYGFYRYARYQKIFDTEKWVKLVITERLEKVLSIDNIVCLFNEEFEKLVCLRQ